MCVSMLMLYTRSWFAFFSCSPLLTCLNVTFCPDGLNYFDSVWCERSESWWNMCLCAAATLHSLARPNGGVVLRWVFDVNGSAKPCPFFCLCLWLLVGSYCFPFLEYRCFFLYSHSWGKLTIEREKERDVQHPLHFAYSRSRGPAIILTGKNLSFLFTAWSFFFSKPLLSCMCVCVSYVPDDINV